jgi:hypothetical protein
VLGLVAFLCGVRLGGVSAVDHATESSVHTLDAVADGAGACRLFVCSPPPKRWPFSRIRRV